MRHMLTRSVFAAALIGIAGTAATLGGSAAIAAGINAAAHRFQDTCAANTQLDRSTVEQARDRIAAAGYSEVDELKKGCDNYWHASAVRNGRQLLVLMSPDGQIARDTE
jgi:hypothetical protein